MQHTHITRAHLKGYRNIQDTEATFRVGLNIVIGPNGCGKSNFLWLLANRNKESINSTNIETIVEGKLVYDEKNYLFLTEKTKHTFNSTNVTHSKIKKNTIFTIKTMSGEENTVDNIDNFLTYILMLGFELPKEILNFSKSSSIKIDKSGNILLADSNNIVNGAIFKKSLANKNVLDIYTLDYFNFSDNILKKTAKYTPVEDIKIKFPVSEDDLEQNANSITIRNLIYEFKINGNWFEWNELSDGTRRILWIVLNILTTNEEIILIEEPELGIHPEQLFLLMEFIKEQSERKQFIITTHSPEVLDVLDSDELDSIKIARYDAERKTTVIDDIPAERQVLIQEYMAKTGLLSGYWLHANLEGVKKWK